MSECKTLRRRLYEAYRRTANAVCWPIICAPLLQSGCGLEHGLRMRDKLALLRAFKRNTRLITSATGWDEHMMLAAGLLSVPRSVPGVVLECGCFKGASTSSLSLVCAAIGRELHVFDSFEGLPDIQEDDRLHVSLDQGRYEEYAKGQYAGALDEVRGNVSKHGKIDVCTFTKGYFEDTLPGLDRPVAFAFLDVDLNESLKTCLKHIWPCLSEGGVLFTHEAKQLAFTGIFFDKAWWCQELGCEAPGLVGAGSGIPAGIGEACGLGYIRKISASPLRESFRSFCGDPTS